MNKDNALTSQQQIDNNFCMLGRILPREKCPICAQSFQLIAEKDGYVCPEHQTRPTRYIIYTYPFGMDRYLYSDPYGNPFTDYFNACRQLERMRGQWDDAKRGEGVFDPDKWIPRKAVFYRFEPLVKEWIRGYDLEARRDAKSEMYVQHLKCYMDDYLIPKFKKYDIRKIRKKVIDELYHDLLERDLATKTIKNILGALNTFLKAHIEIVQVLPSFPTISVTPKKEKNWLGTEKQIDILGVVPEKYQLAIELLFDTGHRTGEIRALKARDLVDGCVVFSRAFSGNRLRLRTKTGKVKSMRVSYGLYTRLVEHCKDKQPDDFMFTIDGRYMGPNRLYRVVKKACVDLKIEHVPVSQASRHSKVSQIRQQKEIEALHEAARQVGHSNIQTTERHYSIDGTGEVK